MNALIILADGFETVEALLTYDLLKRTHRFDVRLVSTNPTIDVVSSQGVPVKDDLILEEAPEADMLILPGGKLGVENLSKGTRVHALIRAYLESGRDVHAICAAPSILGKLGFLDGLPYTCFPGFQTGKGEYLDQGVVETPHIITGHSMGYTVDFGKTIIAHYYGEEAVNAILPGVLGLH